MKFTTTHVIDGVPKQIEVKTHPFYADVDTLKQQFQVSKDLMQEYAKPAEIEFAESVASEAIDRTRRAEGAKSAFWNDQLYKAAIHQVTNQILDIIKPLVEPQKMSVRNIRLQHGHVYADVYGTHPTNFIRQRGEYGSNYWDCIYPEEVCIPGYPEECGAYIGVSPAYYIQNLQRLLDEATMSERRAASDARSEFLENYGG